MRIIDNLPIGSSKFNVRPLNRAENTMWLPKTICEYNRKYELTQQFLSHDKEKQFVKQNLNSYQTHCIVNSLNIGV
jgi:hypothetical protein